jgi:hypothetical protein
VSPLNPRAVLEPRPQSPKLVDFINGQSRTRAIACGAGGTQMTILKLSYVASSGPSAPTAIMPGDLIHDATRWRVAADAYQLILFKLVVCEQLAKSGAQTFVLAPD